MTRFATVLIAFTAACFVFATPAGAAPSVALEGHVWGASLKNGEITAHRGAGATVYIAEYPELSTTADDDGAWSLQVPDHAEITPCADFDGHHPTCNQTYFTRGGNLNQVNFQMVDNLIAQALAFFSGADANIDEEGVHRVKECAIVSTFYEKEKRSFLDFQDFLDGAPHGVAGATAVATSESGQVLPGPVYYNESVIPDRAFSASSRDGGVMWVNIPPGVYTITSSHPTARFATFRATCQEGRLINASPPWGLYEMARNEEPHPAVLPPDPDLSVTGNVVASRVVRSGKHRLLKVTVKAGEKLRVRIEARQGKRKSGKEARVKAKRTIVSLRIGKNFRKGSLQARVTMTDAAGNKAVSSARLAVPRRPGRAR